MVERLAFPAPKATYDINSFPGELIMIPRASSRSDVLGDSNDRVPGIFLPSLYARFLIICFHGNAEDLGRTYQFLCEMRDIFKVHVLSVEYPGYGIAGGTCSEAGIMSNARVAMHFATKTLEWPLDGIKLFGRSLGTGPAIALASEFDVAGLILVTPFLSVREVLRNALGSLADVADDCFRNYKLVDQIEAPTLLIHGTRDSLVPVSHGLWIYEQLAVQKMMVCPDKWYHNSSLLDNLNMFVTPMTQFFSLPDYTFTDIELPHWVLPEHLHRAKDRNKGPFGGGRSPRPVRIEQVYLEKDPTPEPL